MYAIDLLIQMLVLGKSLNFSIYFQINFKNIVVFSGSRTSFSTEKALCHFIVLALLLEDKYQVDGAILSQELNAPRAKVNKYAHIVQALPKSRTSILALRLPKNVPPLPTNYRRKKN